jgi:hypothetical protein
VAQTKTDAVVKTGPAALAVPSFMTQGDRRGSETITRDEIQMPRLALAQGLSPELDKTSPRYIPGLTVGDAFNSLTSEIYGDKPLELVIIRVDKPRYIEFDDTNRGSIKDFNVPANDPRTMFTTDDKGNTIKPKATKFMEYVALLLPSNEPIALSFKGAGLKVAKQLNGLIRLANLPAFALRYTFTPAIMKDAKSGGTYSVFNIKYAPKAEGQDRPYVDQSTYEFASTMYESIKDQTLAVEREPGQDDDDDQPIAPGTGF